jgi:hypothetical protein
MNFSLYAYPVSKARVMESPLALGGVGRWVDVLWMNRNQFLHLLGPTGGQMPNFYIFSLHLNLVRREDEVRDGLDVRDNMLVVPHCLSEEKLWPLAYIQASSSCPTLLR